jgi:hypothetical protein
MGGKALAVRKPVTVLRADARRLPAGPAANFMAVPALVGYRTIGSGMGGDQSTLMAGSQNLLPVPEPQLPEER